MRVRLAVAPALIAGLAASAQAQEINSFAVLFGPVGARDVKTWDLPVRWEGSVVVRFQSAFGSGQVVWTPGQSGQFTVAEYRTRKGGQMTAFLAPTGSSGASARVESRSGVCTDTAGAVLDAAAISPAKDGVRIGLAGATPASGGFHMTETRCGGPLFDDIGRALRTVHVRRQQLVKGRFDIDLRGAAPLAVPGMQASVESTVVGHVGARAPEPKQPPDRATSGGPTRELTVSYRIERVSGGLTAALTGGGELCAELDSCGRTETLDLQAGAPRRERLDLSAYTSKGRTLADLRAALGLPGARGRTKGVQWSGFGSWSSRTTTLAAVLSDRVGELCRDKRRIAGLALLLQPVGGRVRADLATDPTAAPRTSCPGLSLTGGELAVLASGYLPRSALRRDRVTLRLTRGHPIVADGWSGQTKADVAVVIRRVSVKVEKLPF
jgi:hypothetical protein